jgi:hypothetical protein
MNSAEEAKTQGLTGRGGTMKAGRSIIAAAVALFGALALLVTASAALANPPSIMHLGSGSFTAPLTSTCTSAITLDGSFSNDTLTAFFDHNGNQTAVIDRFDEVDTFVGPTGKTLVGDPYHSVSQVRFDSSGNASSVYSLGVLERVTLPDGKTALFAGRLNLLTATAGSFVFTPDTGHSSDLAGFCAALGAGHPAS